jgi:hypothetical protein
MRTKLRPVAVLVGLIAGCLATGVLYLLLGTEALAMPTFMLAVPRWPLGACRDVFSCEPLDAAAAAPKSDTRRPAVRRFESSPGESRWLSFV